MKKIFVVLLASILFSIAGHAQSNFRSIGSTTESSSEESGKIFLQHNGNVKAIFSSNDLAGAIANAVEGDTIFLSSGTFTGDVAFSKAISIIGVGADESVSTTYTQYTGSMQVTPSSQTQMLGKILLEGISFAQQTTFAGIDDLVLRKCYFSNYLYFGSSSEKSSLKKVLIDRCYVSNLTFYSSVGELLTKNSRIYSISDHSDMKKDSKNFANIYFDHCNISTTSMNAIYSNSIINGLSNLSKNSFLVNVLYYSSSSTLNANLQDCYNETNSLLLSSGSNYEKLAGKYSIEDLKVKKYFGYDETVVGIEGGVNPFSLKRHVPTFTNKSLYVDPKTKKLSVDIKVTAN